MSLTTVMVHVDAGRATPGRIGLALSLAGEQGARLVGIHHRECDAAADRVAQRRRFAAAAEARAIFHEDVAGAPVAAGWRDGGDAAEVDEDYDLLVVGQADEDDDASGWSAASLERIAARARASVLVVPQIGGWAPFRRILIGGAARPDDLAGIRPLLARAEAVLLLASPEDRAVVRLRRWLADGGIAATVLPASDGGLSGEAVLDEAYRTLADLVVLGVPDRGDGLDETVRSVLGDSAVPVLLSRAARSPSRQGRLIAA